MRLSPLDPFLEPLSTLLGQGLFRRTTLNLADVCAELLGLPVPTSLLLQGVSTCFFGFPTAPYFLLELIDVASTAQESTEVTFHFPTQAVSLRFAASP
jgi:hypothetical protein